MPDFIQLPPDGGGKRLLCTYVVVDGVGVYLENDRIAGADGSAADVRSAAPDLSDFGVVVRPVFVSFPVRGTLIANALVPGQSADLDFAVVPNGKAGKLMAATFTSSVPAKWAMKECSGGSEAYIDIVMTGGISDRPTMQWRTPDREFSSLAGNGSDTFFRVTVTSLDQRGTADAMCTLYWDQA